MSGQDWTKSNLIFSYDFNNELNFLKLQKELFMLQQACQYGSKEISRGDACKMLENFKNKFHFNYSGLEVPKK